MVESGAVEAPSAAEHSGGEAFPSVYGLAEDAETNIKNTMMNCSTPSL